MIRLFSRQSLLRYGLATGMTVLVSALSLLPARFFHQTEASLPPIRGLDKLAHLLMYAALTASYLHAARLPKGLKHRSAVWGIALLATLYGVAMELCQKWLTTTRCMDPFDALANTLGAFACAFFMCVVVRRRLAAATN